MGLDSVLLPFGDSYFNLVIICFHILADGFLLGLARGAGTAVGFSILGALVVMLLQNLAKKNLPLIGGFLAELARLVLERL